MARLICVILAALTLFSLVACADIGSADNAYTKNIYPAAASTYDIADNTTRFRHGYFDNVTTHDLTADNGTVLEIWIADNVSIHTVDGSPLGPIGMQGPAGPQGPQGNPGPNNVSIITTTNITGILTGDGANVGFITDGSVDWDTAYTHSQSAHAPSTANMSTATYDPNQDGIIAVAQLDTGLTLVNGTRPFTGTVGGITPVAAADLTTKEYVDLAVAGSLWEYFFNDTASGVGAYYDMGDPTGQVMSTFTTAGLATGDDQLLTGWITDAAVGFTTVNAGVIHLHIHAERTAGTKPVTLYGIIYEREAGGAEHVIATTEDSGLITVAVDVDLHATLATNYEIAATSFIVVNFYANVGLAGADVDISLYAEGTTSSRVGVTAPSVPVVGYTDEEAQDAVGAMSANTTTINLTYTDGIPELKADIVTEGLQDLVGAMAGGAETGIAVTYNDGTGMLDYAVSITQYTDELAQDAVGGIMGDTTTIDLTYDDAGNAISAAAVTEGIEDLAGAMADGAESGITVSYNDATGNLDYTVTAGGSWTTSTVQDDVVVTNSAVLVDATGISFTTTASTQYTIRLKVFFATTSATADFKYRLTHAGTTTRVWRQIISGEGNNLPTYKAPVNAFDVADQTLLDTAAATLNIIQEDIILQVGASGGVLKLQFAQNTATVGQSATVFEGSYIEYATS